MAVSARCAFAAASAVTWLAATACEPCSSTFACTRPPVAAVVGQIVDEWPGLPVGNVRIDVSRDSGVALQPSVGTVFTEANGTFALELPASAEGDVFVTVTVSAPEHIPYKVPGVKLRATRSGGDATVLPPWVSFNPTVPYGIIVVRDPGILDSVPNVLVEFRRTAGPQMIQYFPRAPLTTVQGTTGTDGRLYLFQNVRADAAGVITGDLVVRLSATGDSIVLKQVTWRAVPRFEEPLTMVYVIVGALQ